MTEPDGTERQWGMSRTQSGIFETKINALKSGVYRFHLKATGLSARGHPFTREHLLTALVGRKSGTPGSGNVPSGGEDGSGDFGDQLCRLIECLSDRKVFDERFQKLLAELGIDGREAARCLRDLCLKKDMPRLFRTLDRLRQR
jgi:hypothetical protein